MYHHVVFLAQWYEVVFVVLVEVLNVSRLACLLLLGDVVNIFNIFIA